MIYFIADVELLHVKIGFTRKDLYRRVAELQTGNPLKLIVMAIMPGTMQDERNLHRKFDHCRKYGEWFEIRNDLKEYIELHGKPAPPEPIKEIMDYGNYGRNAIISMDKTLSEIGDKLGFTGQYVGMILRKSRNPSNEFKARALLEFNIPLDSW